MVRITGTRYCGNIFCQPFVQYLDLSSHFNKTMPRLTVLAKWLHGCCRPRLRTSSDCSAVSAKKRTLWTSDFIIVIVRLRTSCYWVVVQSYVYVILFTVWFLSNAKTNFPETLHYSLQYIRVCVHKIMFDSVNFIACYQEICNGVTFIGTQCIYKHYGWIP